MNLFNMEILLLILFIIVGLIAICSFINELCTNKRVLIIELLIFIIVLVALLSNVNIFLLYFDVLFKLYYSYIGLLIFFIYEVVSFIVRVNKSNNKKLIFDSLKEVIKNDTSDFYFLLDNKDTIIDYSSSIIKLSGKKDSELRKLKKFNVIFKTFKLIKLNNEDIDSINFDIFVTDLKRNFISGVSYSFECDLLINNSVVKYTAIASGIYNKQKLIGTMVNLYEDKSALIKKLSKNNELLTSEVISCKNILHTLMTLSEGVVMYYDYTDKCYYLTESFRSYLNITNSTLTFEEFFYMIDESDRDRYAIESKNVNAGNVNRIKFKLKINNILFNAVEDSMYLSEKDQSLVSIIHVTSRCDDDFDDGVISSVDTIKLLEELSNIRVTPTINKALKELDKALKDTNND